MRWLSRILAAVQRGYRRPQLPEVKTDGDTEFIAEVVRITEVLPHPNADKLEILHFERKSGPTAYTVVDRKGRKPGDLVCYFGVDSIVPTDHPAFKFLRERPDGAGKATFRLRAIRLRGVYSEGLITDTFGPKPLGHPLAEPWGIGYHNPAPPETPAGPQAPKRRKDWRNTAPQYGVESLRKAPFLFETGEEVWVTEKVHGCNARFGWIRGQFVVGSHRVWKTDNRRWWARLLGLRKNSGGPGWYREDVWLTAIGQNGLEGASAEFPGIVFYGEIYGYTPGGKPIQDLTYGLRPGAMEIRLFDAFDVKTRRWLPRPDLVVMAAQMGCKVVPYLDHGPFSLDLVKVLAEGPSTIEPGHIREGVVVTSADGARRGKYVGEGYRLRKDA